MLDPKAKTHVTLMVSAVLLLAVLWTAYLAVDPVEALRVLFRAFFWV